MEERHPPYVSIPASLVEWDSHLGKDSVAFSDGEHKNVWMVRQYGEAMSFSN